MTPVSTPQAPLALRHTTPRSQWVLGLLACTLLAACASTPPPTEQLAVSTAAVASATSAGAQEMANAELTMARDKLARANAAVAADHNERALLLAQQAQVDARLAEVRAQSAKAHKAATEVGESNRVLSEEMNRGAK